MASGICTHILTLCQPQAGRSQGSLCEPRQPFQDISLTTYRPAATWWAHWESINIIEVPSSHAGFSGLSL